MSKDYYKILGVARDADAKEIKRAFRKLAKEYHPDQNGDPEAVQKFKEINEAFSVLSNPDKRHQYDQVGYDGSRADGGGNGGFSGGFNPGAQGYSGDFGDLGSIFESMFGGGGGFRRQRDNRGADLSLRLDASFEEAVFGTEKEFSYQRQVSCDKCNGTGATDGKTEICSTCGGSGKVRRTVQTMLGTMATETVCPDCGGQGKRISSPCGYCNGDGRVIKTEKTKIKIPAGAESGIRLRFRGKGDVGIRGGAAGDLYITIVVKEKKEFTRRNGDIYITVPISPATAVLGGEQVVPSVNGPITMKIPKGIQGGTELRLRGKGGPRLRGSGIGDQYVTIIIDIPKRISASGRKLWEQLRENEDKKDPEGIFKKVFG